ncbi:MAG: hypothetical protein P8Z77_07865 [Candidatus Thiodiazotropha sp.]
MFKRSKIYQSMLLALVLPGVAVAEVEVSGYLKNETSVFTRDGQVTGEADSMLDERGHESGDLMKFENSARVFLKSTTITRGISSTLRTTICGSCM